jgi:thiamine biosynthesis lipoprotein
MTFLGKRLISLAMSLCFCLLCLPLTGCDSRQKYSVTWWDVFDTVTTVTGYAASQTEWNSQTQALHTDLQHYNQLFDIYNTYPGVTNLATVNAMAGQGAVPVDGEILALLTLGKEIYTATGGSCNAAGGAVLRLWHDAREAGLASPESAALPALSALQTAAQHCRMEDLVLDASAGTVALTDPEMSLDVGSIGKGFATEAAAKAAQARGLSSALLNVGGNLRAIGEKPDGKPWTAGVENPWPDADGQIQAQSYVAAVALRDGESLVTSGDYQRYYTVDGVRYSHLIDPKTLYPARYSASVSVLCADSGEADALSTGLFCMTVADGLALAEARPGVEAIWLSSAKTTTLSSGFAAREIKTA